MAAAQRRLPDVPGARRLSYNVRSGAPSSSGPALVTIHSGETTMGQINVGRVVIGGIVAAVILCVAGFIIHGAILGSQWAAWQSAGHMPNAMSHGGAIVIWIIVSLVNGLTGVWIYAGIRPRYGAGPKTALIAGFLLWLA